MRKKLFLLLLISATAITSFAQSGTTIYDSIVSGGIQRKFRLYIPNIYNASQPAPLVLNLHGYTSNASQQMAYSNFMPIADTAGFLIVHPDRTANNGAQYWNAGFGAPVNDVLFLSSLIDSISDWYSIDADRVYSCGMSNGGIMSYYLACNLPNKVTAIASVTGCMLKSWFNCTPSFLRAFPVMEIHGTNDATVPYNGDNTFANTDSTVKKWRIYNNCNSSPSVSAVPDVVTSDNSTATHYVYTGGYNGSTVELYKVSNGSHSWPGAFPFIANTNQDFNASAEIWRFFSKYKLSELSQMVGIKNIKMQGDAVKIYPNPTEKMIYISSELLVKKVVITDALGKILSASSSNIIDISQFSAGTYIVAVSTENGVIYKKLLKQ